MEHLKLSVNLQKTPMPAMSDEVLEFLGYRIGTNYRHGRGEAYVDTRPSRTSVQNKFRKVSEQTAGRYGAMDTEKMIERLNRLLSGWASYFCLGQLSPAYAAIDAHKQKRLRRWLFRKHKMKSGKNVRFSDDRLYGQYGLTHLFVVNQEPAVGVSMISSESRM